MRRTAITVFAALGAACTVGVTSSGSQAVTSGLGLAMTGSASWSGVSGAQLG
jgi:hypothetical protein